jgi:serine protease AprX
MNVSLLNLKMWLSLTVITAGSAFTYSQVTAEKEGSPQGYIVQGASQATMTEQINAVGGKITHSFNVINAVSAALTPSQMAQVSSANPMLRLFANSDVELNGNKGKGKGAGWGNTTTSDSSTTSTESSTDSADVITLENSGWDSGRSLDFNLAERQVHWMAKNFSGTKASIAAFDISWPLDNGKLTSLSLAGKKVAAGNNGALSIQLHGANQIAIGNNGLIRLGMAFEAITSLMEDDYSIKVTLSDGLELELIPYDQELVAPAPIRYALDSSKLAWKTLSRSLDERGLTQVMIDWPTANGNLKNVKINGENVISSAKSGGRAAFDVEYEDDLGIGILIKPQSEIEVELEFEQLVSVTDSSYNVFLAFSDGSRKSFSTTNSTPQQGENRDTFFPTIVRANEAHSMGITGDGVTVAIIDSGMQDFKKLTKNNRDTDRISHVYNVLDTNRSGFIEDSNGHGTHIASVISNSSPAFALSGEMTTGYNSIAPGADLVIVKAFDENGRASYADILSAIEYVVENKDALNIQVLNLSFSATPSSNYWEDPINQALMVAWQSGITVVAAAGNQGPDAMTIGVPGNNPYIITVGAVSDNYSPDNLDDDFVTTFSSAGPTYEGFVKPELVAPGGHIQGLMNGASVIGSKYAMYDDGSDYFLLSGSSQSTAITSGIVALMLQDSPSLTPDDIKCRLVDTAKAAVTDDGQLAFSIFQQGAGMVDAIRALNSSAQGCGNAGLDIAADIAGEHHFVGPAKRHENNGDFYVPDQEGLEWNGLYSDAHLWGNIRFISDAHLWGNIRFNSDAHLWGNIRFISDAHLWGNISFNSDAHLWGNIRFNADSNLVTDSVQTEWVDQE